MKDYIGIIKAYLALMRVKNGTIAFFGVFVGAAIMTGNFPFDFYIIVAGISAFLILSGGNALNDYFDYRIDKINKPGRPLPSKKIARSDAMMFAISIFVIGVAAAHLINQYCFYLSIINSVILIVYAKYSKQVVVLPNLAISYLVASVFIFGALTVIYENLTGNYTLLFIMFTCAFFMTLAREITKDIEDIEGDRSVNSLTIPIKFGEGDAVKLAALSTLSAIILSAIPYFLNLLTNNNPYLFFIIIADSIFIFSLTQDAEKSSKIMIYGMFAAMVGFFFGVINI